MFKIFQNWMKRIRAWVGPAATTIAGAAFVILGIYQKKLSQILIGLAAMGIGVVNFAITKKTHGG